MRVLEADCTSLHCTALHCTALHCSQVLVAGRPAASESMDCSSAAQPVFLLYRNVPSRQRSCSSGSLESERGFKVKAGQDRAGQGRAGKGEPTATQTAYSLLHDLMLDDLVDDQAACPTTSVQYAPSKRGS